MREKIEHILDRAIVGDIDNLAPNNYTEVKELVLQKEFHKEVNIIKSMLLEYPNLEGFKEGFKQRCLLREQDKSNSISFLITPNTASNKLYWDIAQVLFEPQTQQAMLSILLPSTKHLLKSDLDYEINHQLVGKQKYKPKISVELKDNLDELNSVSNFEDMAHYVFSDGALFNAKEIKNFPLETLSSLNNILAEDYPELARNLNQHNGSFQTLIQDINTITNKGLTPLEAIEQLIQGLTMGGEKMTGRPYASKVSLEAAGRFSEYYNSLPTETKKELRNLEANGKSIGSIIDGEIAQGQCVETTSVNLTAILKENRHVTLLTAPPQMTQSDLKILREKYGHKRTLDTQKDDSLSLVLPTELTHDVIQRIQTRTSEDLVDLIIKFPASFYNDLWQHIEIAQPERVFQNLNILIGQGYFIPEQRQALAIAIVKNRNRFILPDDEPVINWALNETKDNPEIQLLLKNEYLMRDLSLLLINELETNPEHCLETLTSSLEQFDNDKKLAFLKNTDKYGNTLLMLAANNLSVLTYLLDSYPDNQKLDAIKKINKLGYTALHVAEKNKPCFEFLLGLFTTKDQALAAMKMQNSQTKETLMQIIKSGVEAVKMILKFVPNNELLDLCRMPGKLLSNIGFQSFILIFESIAKEARMRAFETLTIDALQTITSNPQHFMRVLNSLPKENWLEVFEICTRHADHPILLNFATNHPEDFKQILELLSENEKKGILLLKNRNGQSFWQTLTNIETIVAILQSFPVESRMGVLDYTSDTQGVNSLLSKSFEILKAILEQLPNDDERLTALLKPMSWLVKSLVVGYGIENTLKLLASDKQLEVLKGKTEEQGTIVHSIAKDNPAQLYKILPNFSNEQMLDLLNTQNETGRTVFHTLASNLISQFYADAEKRRDLLKNFLESLPENIRIDLIKSVTITEYGMNILHDTMASDYHETFYIILNSLPGDKKLEVLNTTTNNGTTVLHYATRNSDVLKTILTLYPELAIMQPNQNGDTALDFALLNGREKSAAVLMPLISEDQRKEVETKLLDKSASFCIKKDSLVHFIKLFEQTDLEYKDQKKLLDEAANENAPKIMNWLTDKELFLNSQRFNAFCKKPFVHTNEFKPILDKYIDCSFKEKDRDYLETIISTSPHLQNEPQFKEHCNGIDIMFDCFKKMNKIAKKTNSNEAKELENVIQTQIKGYINGNKDSHAFLKNAADAKKQLEDLIGDKNRDPIELLTELKKHLLKGTTSSQQQSYGFFAKSTNATSTTAARKDKKKDDDDDLDPGLGSGSGRNCIIS